MIRCIYDKDYSAFHRMYKGKTISTELGMTIGSVVNSQAIINQVLKMEEKRSEIDMCEALERWREEAIQEGMALGREEGIEQGIVKIINTCRKFHISEEETLENLREEFMLSEQEAQNI